MKLHFSDQYFVHVYVQVHDLPGLYCFGYRARTRERDRERERKRYKHRLMFMKDLFSRFIFGSSSRIRSGIQGGLGVWRKLNESAKENLEIFVHAHEHVYVHVHG